MAMLSFVFGCIGAGAPVVAIGLALAAERRRRDRGNAHEPLEGPISLFGMLAPLCAGSALVLGWLARGSLPPEDPLRVLAGWGMALGACGFGFMALTAVTAVIFVRLRRAT